MVTQQFAVVHNFNGSDGSQDFGGPLAQGADGALYGVTVGGGAANKGTAFRLSLQASVSIHSVGNAIVSASYNIDDSLKPPTDESRLALQPSVTAGLVADGVTPLLIKLQTTPLPSQSTTYHITTAVSGGCLLSGALNEYLRVLQSSSSGGGRQFVPGDTLTLSPSHPIGFAYIGGITSDDVQFAAGSKELSVTLSVTKDGDATRTATVQFRIRKPPIVLVHGYNSDKSAWYSDGEAMTVPTAFLEALENTFPADFILPVEYGVRRSPSYDKTKNIAGAFEELAPLLDTELQAKVENSQSLWHRNWAFTRYNIVGHSQGGLLARMLCTSKDPSPNATPSDPDKFRSFRSVNNANRGRFHRVITFNTPHNGSTLLRYLLTLKMRRPDNVAISIIELIGDLIQEKFDPFPDDSQIKKITNEWTVDPDAKFHLIGTSIHHGESPAPAEVFPACYYETGLTRLVSNQNHTRGWVVIPSGSDGVVDFSSEFAGSSSNKASPIVGDISHSPPIAAFWDHPFSGITNATANATLGETVAQLLNGPACEFGSLTVQPVDPALGGQIDNTVPPVLTTWQLIQQFAPPSPSPSMRATSMSSASVYQYWISPQLDQEPDGPPSWYAKIFGPAGIVTDGVTATPDTNDPEIVSVTVDDSVIGDVVLYASYGDTNGNLIAGAPVVVVSRPPGANVNGIELVPEDISLTTGSSVNATIWVDYDNGIRSQLYVQSGAPIIYSSDDPAVASVDSIGTIELNTPGTTNIHVSYLGFSAQSSVNVSALPPPPAIAPIISGTASYCPNPSLGPVPNVTFTMAGDAMSSATSDVAGNYQFSFLPSGGSYTVTPTKSTLTPGSAGINTVDVIAVQRHFLNITPLPPGCRLTAANVNGDSAINTIDVIAIQKFFLIISGTANVGKYQFIPANRTYTGVVTDQTSQNYDALIYGDVAGPFADRPEGQPQTATEPATVATVALPDVAVDQSKNNFVAAVTTTAVDAKNKMVGFQGDFTFDERVITFQSEPGRKAGLTGDNWNVSGNVLPGAGPIRTLRISAYSNDFTRLSGSGTLFELRMTRVSTAGQGTQLVWAAPPDNFIFIDADLKTQKPGNAAPGSVTPSGKRRLVCA